MAARTSPPKDAGPTWNEGWLFVFASGVTLALAIALFAALRILGGVFHQARNGAMEALLVQSAAIGVIVMASIQMVRAIVPVRSWFHRQRVSTWLGRAPDELRKTADFKARMRELIDGDNDKWLEEYISPETTEQEILHRLLQLTTAEGGDRPAVSLAFFDLPLEQLCGQISAGAERAIVDPKTNGAILLRLANAAGEDDVVSLFKAHRKVHQQRPGEGSAPGQAPPDSSSGEPRVNRTEEQFMRARASVEERVRRSIDCLQIESGFYWRRRLRGLAVALAATLGATAALVGGQPLASALTAAVSGIIGGFFAMLARDLTAIVERLRRIP